MLFTNHKGQPVGELLDGVYRKVVNREKHLMRIFNGYGIDSSILERIIEEGCREIRVKETDTGNILSTTPESFMENGVGRDFGDGSQVFLPLKYFEVSDDSTPKMI